MGNARVGCRKRNKGVVRIGNYQTVVQRIKGSAVDFGSIPVGIGEWTYAVMASR